MNKSTEEYLTTQIKWTTTLKNTQYEIYSLDNPRLIKEFKFAN